MIFNYFLGLGSNIEPRLNYITNAATELRQSGEIIRKSSIYESEAWGYKKQSKFLNAVIQFQSDLEPNELLRIIKIIEINAGRSLSKINWGPREIDIDILFADGINIQENNLEIPHKYFHKRKFVLLPMAEINSGYIVENNSIEYYLNKCKDSLTVKRVKSIW